MEDRERDRCGLTRPANACHAAAAHFRVKRETIGSVMVHSEQCKNCTTTIF